MKVVFVSNYFNHHQKPFSDAMDRLTNHSYCFIETEKMSEERIKLGWAMNDHPSYVKSMFSSQENQLFCQRLIDEAEVVIFGSMPEILLKNRLKRHKLTFRYSERLLKRKPPFWKDFLKKIVYPLRNNRKNTYLLCASAYTSADYLHYGCYKNRAYQWGYFPEAKNYSDIDELIKKKEKASILWVARLIEWKHPDASILVAERLKKAGYKFQLNLIGIGVMDKKIAEMIKTKGLEDCVFMLGAMKPNEVRAHMEKSEVFMFTSDRNEGWGAVLNEAMNSGCAVVASHAIGSVPFLVNDGQNGLIYKDGDLDDLYNKVKYLLDNDEKREEITENAYNTIANEWNADVAAERLLALIEDLQKQGRSDRFNEGPCSKAKKLRNDWYC